MQIFWKLKTVGKGDNWKNDVPAKSVKCSDGEAEL